MPITITTSTILPSGPPFSQDTILDTYTQSMPVVAIHYASRAWVHAKHYYCHHLYQVQSQVAPRYCLLHSPMVSHLPPQQWPCRRMNITNKSEVERRRRNQESHIRWCTSWAFMCPCLGSGLGTKAIIGLMGSSCQTVASCCVNQSRLHEERWWECQDALISFIFCTSSIGNF